MANQGMNSFKTIISDALYLAQGSLDKSPEEDNSCNG
nr:MAG TPA: hypothetical protein [Caudoviricetes sp.]